MGLQDRDYYRRSPPRTFGGVTVTSLRAPAVTGLLIAIGLVFVAQHIWPAVTAYLAFTPALGLGRGWLWQLVTYAFCHDVGSLWHILFNAFVLYWAGREVERYQGTSRFLWLAGTAAVVAALAHAVQAYLRGAAGVPMLGASGMVMAALVVLATYRPRSPTYIWFVGPFPLWFVVAALLGLDVLLALGRPDGVAHLAHLGGAAWGYVWRRLDLDPGRWLGQGWRAVRRPRGRVERPSFGSPAPEGAEDAGAPPGSHSDEALREEVDRILAKISSQGLGSLLPEERDTLEIASRRFGPRP